MRLITDLIRDILLCIEKNTGLHESCYFIDEKQMDSICFVTDEEPDAIPKYQEKLIEGKPYDAETVFYHVTQCAEAGLIKIEKGTPTYKIIVSGLTMKGHEFTENIRDKGNWTAIKGKAKKVGSFALSVMEEVAKAYALSRIGNVL